MALIWRSFCESCDWIHPGAPSRDDAVANGRFHVRRHHARDEEWSFRVQGIRTGPKALQAGGALVRRRFYASHAWEAHPTSRSRNLPCGVCGVYRYTHDDIFRFVADPAAHPMAKERQR